MSSISGAGFNSLTSAAFGDQVVAISAGFNLNSISWFAWGVISLGIEMLRGVAFLGGSPLATVGYVSNFAVAWSVVIRRGLFLISSAGWVSFNLPSTVKILGMIFN